MIKNTNKIERLKQIWFQFKIENENLLVTVSYVPFLNNIHYHEVIPRSYW